MENKAVDISSILDDDFSDSDLSLKKAILISACFFIGQFVMWYPVKLIIQMTSRLEQQVLDVVASSLVNVLTVCCFVYLSKRLIVKSLHGERHVDAAWRIGKPIEIALGIFLGVFTYFCVEFLLGIFSISSATVSNFYTENDKLTSVLGSKSALVITFFNFLMFSPVEEMLFRGVLFGGLSKKIGLFAAIIISTMLFVLAHFPGDWYAVLNYSIFSFVAVYLRLKSKAIGPPVAYHLSYNFSILTYMATR